MSIGLDNHWSLLNLSLQLAFITFFFFAINPFITFCIHVINPSYKLSIYEAQTLLGLGVSDTKHDTDTYNYTKLCNFLKLLAVCRV